MAPNDENTFYARRGKRLFDATVAAFGLVFVLPVFVVVAALVKLSSPGPVFFVQERVGRGGRSFRIAKFRSMFLDAERRGLAITSARDPRITWIGAVLRRLKLDELPQLWNVLKGDMSLVGPRPEVPRYVTHFTPAQRGVFIARPGITDPASILYRDEEKILGNQEDPDRYYREVVLPHKLDLNLAYVHHISLLYDLRLIWQTAVCILRPSLPPVMPQQQPRT